MKATTKAQQPRRVYIITFVVLITMLAFTLLTPFDAVGQSLVHATARSAGMGGAYTAVASGVHAPRYNPANLGIYSHRQSGIELVSVGANVSNNSFTLDDYNNYTGSLLTSQDKQDIMDKIPSEGLRLQADVEAAALSISLGKFALNVTGIGVADVNLNKDIIDLILNGNTYADTLNVNGSFSNGHSYITAGLSYGELLYSDGVRQLAVGATFKYIKGIAAENLVELEGYTTTTTLGFDGAGTAIVQTATGGHGLSLDVGSALQINKNYMVGARVQNVFGSITWDKQAEEHGYVFTYDGASIDDIQDDDFIGSEDYSIPIDNFTTTLPTVLNVGIARQTSNLLVAVDYVQGLENTPGASTDPRLAIGAEYTLFGFLPLRSGFSTGADRSPAFSFGSGLHFAGFYMDAAVLTGSNLNMYSAKGANFALSLGVNL